MEVKNKNRDGEVVLNFTRPFRCCCPEIGIDDNEGNHLGDVICRCFCFRMCCCGEVWFEVKDAAGNSISYMKYFAPVLCNGCKNCCAPSCCNPSHENEITNLDGKVIGRIRNVFSLLGCVTDVDHYFLSFPQGSSAAERALYLGGLTLWDYTVFSRRNQNDDS